MGKGDEIMASAQARAVAESVGVKASFGEWSKIWKHNPYIAKQGGFPVRNATGDRPYLLGQTDRQCIFNPNFRVVPGDIYLDDSELEAADDILNGLEGFIFVQPEVKKMFSKGNKAWVHWNALIRKLQDETILQPLSNVSETEKALKGVKTIVTETFRTAIAVMLKAKLVITCDGGIHHAAAARIHDSRGNLLSDGIPSVVIWTGFSHPRNLGYANHLNVRYDDSPPCGMKVPCDHCHNMSEKLTANMVYEAVRSYLDKLSTSVD